MKPEEGHTDTVAVPVAKQPSVLVAGARRLLLAAIRGYQSIVSPWLGPVCRFHPSCSCYGYQAVERHGIVRGLGLTVARLLRCHPFHPGGFDPVPGVTGGSTTRAGRGES